MITSAPAARSSCLLPMPHVTPMVAPHLRMRGSPDRRGMGASRCRWPAVTGATIRPVKIPTPRSVRSSASTATPLSVSRSSRHWRPESGRSGRCARCREHHAPEQVGVQLSSATGLDQRGDHVEGVDCDSGHGGWLLESRPRLDRCRRHRTRHLRLRRAADCELARGECVRDSAEAERRSDARPVRAAQVARLEFVCVEMGVEAESVVG